MNYLAGVAEDRTKLLEAMLKNRQTAVTTMDRPRGPSSGDFFNQNVTKRWDETLNRARPVLTQLVEQLRSAEREWNKQVDKDAAPETYDLPQLAPLMIPADQTVSASPLGPGTKNGTVTRPWRTTYYYSNGYRYPTFTP